MKKAFIIFFVIVSSFVAHGQLLEDTQNRLKTTKKERKGLFRNKKNKKGQPITFAGKGKPVHPNYSPGLSSVFKKRTVEPKYSLGSPFGGRRYQASPRYSYKRSGNVDRGGSSPRYSVGNPFGIGNRRGVSPRYSLGSPFKKGIRVIPRTSGGNPFRAKDYRVNTRYSVGSPFRAKDYRVNTRYSLGSPFTPGIRVRPRYSQGSPFTKKDFRLPRQYKASNNSPSFSTMRYKNPHSDWSEFWDKMSGNKNINKPVKSRPDKPKFDSKERVLWNN